MDENSSFLLFSGTSHPLLAEQISKVLGQRLGKLSIELFPDNEIGVQILENVRGKDVFILQSIARRPNHYLMELFLMIDALKRSSTKSISVVIPYFAYARQDRKDRERVPISAKLVANLLEKSGVDRVLTMDLHTPQIQGFFNICVDHLMAKPLIVSALKKYHLKNLVVACADLSRSKLAKEYAKDLGAEIAFIDKQRVSAKKVQDGSLVGNVKDKQVLIVDDLCSTGRTLQLASKVCSYSGAKKVFVALTHYLPDSNIFQENYIEKIFITDTIPSKKCEKIEIISTAQYFGQAIECVLKAKSISSLYR